MDATPTGPTPDAIDRLAAIITQVQAAPNRRPTVCDLCEMPLRPLVTDDLWAGRNLQLQCPECEDTRDLTPREIIGFRMYAEMLDRWRPPPLT